MSALDGHVVGTTVAIAPLLDRVSDQLPPLISVTVNTSGVSVMPWLAGAPISALLAWAEQLSDVQFRIGRPDAGFDVTEVIARGHLDGMAVDVVAFTHRVITDVRVRRDRVVAEESALRRVADDELQIQMTPAPEETRG